MITPCIQGSLSSIQISIVDPEGNNLESLCVSLFLVKASYLNFKALQYSSSILMFIDYIPICSNSFLTGLLKSIIAGVGNPALISVDLS